MGDLDGDGLLDIAVGAPGDDDGGTNRGAVYVLFTDGAYLDGDGDPGTPGEDGFSKISDIADSFLVDGDEFGISVANIGDLDCDGVPELAVSATNAAGTSQGGGSVWILFLDGDLLQSQREARVRAFSQIRSTDACFNDPSKCGSDPIASTNLFGFSVEGIGDINGDEIPDIVIGEPGSPDGCAIDPCALGCSVSGPVGAVWIVTLNADGTVNDCEKIGAQDTGPGCGGLLDTLDSCANFGWSVSGIMDLDPTRSQSAGVPDLLIGAIGNDDGFLCACGVGGPGGAYVLQLDGNLSIDNPGGETRISATMGGGPPNGPSDFFGSSVASLGDVNGDGVPDAAVGAPTRDPLMDGEFGGAVWQLFLNPSGSVNQLVEISKDNVPAIPPNARFGDSVTWATGLFGSSNALIVGATGVENSRGAIFLVSLYADDDWLAWPPVAISPHTCADADTNPNVLAGPPLVIGANWKPTIDAIDSEHTTARLTVRTGFRCPPVPTVYGLNWIQGFKVYDDTVPIVDGVAEFSFPVPIDSSINQIELYAQGRTYGGLAPQGLTNGTKVRAGLSYP